MTRSQSLQKVPIDKKILLSFSEAAALNSIGINKLRALAKEPTCTWVVKNGANTMVKRVELEKYIMENAGV